MRVHEGCYCAECDKPVSDVVTIVSVPPPTPNGVVSDELENILQAYGMTVYEFKLYEPSAEWNAAKNKAKQAIEQLFHPTQLVSDNSKIPPQNRISDDVILADGVVSDEILPMLKVIADKGYVQKKDVEPIIALITQKTTAARIDELSHIDPAARWFPTDDLYNAVAVSERLMQLQKGDKA
jgi:hypothetical protein